LIKNKVLKEYFESLNASKNKKDLLIIDLIEKIEEWNETHRTFISEIGKITNTINLLGTQIEGLEDRISDYQIREKKHD